MSEFVYPLDGQQDYTAEQAGAWMGTRSNGVWAGDDNLKVSVTGARQLTISPGLAWFTTDDFWGKVYCNTDEISFTLPVADAALDFICRIVIRWNKTANRGYADMLIGAQSSAEVGVTPPARITTDEMYDLVIADYYVKAGETEASAGQLTDQRLNEELCGLMRDGVTRLPTSAFQAQIDALLRTVQTELADLEAGTAVELKKLLFENTVVPLSLWKSDTTYEDYEFRAAVPLDGVIKSMIPDVMLALTEASAGNFAPVSECYNGGVYLYASEKPNGSITIPTIICWRGA